MSKKTQQQKVQETKRASMPSSDVLSFKAAKTKSKLSPNEQYEPLPGAGEASKRNQPPAKGTILSQQRPAGTPGAASMIGTGSMMTQSNVQLRQSFFQSQKINDIRDIATPSLFAKAGVESLFNEIFDGKQAPNAKGPPKPSETCGSRTIKCIISWKYCIGSLLALAMLCGTAACIYALSKPSKPEAPQINYLAKMCRDAAMANMKISQLVAEQCSFVTFHYHSHCSTVKCLIATYDYNSTTNQVILLNETQWITVAEFKAVAGSPCGKNKACNGQGAGSHHCQYSSVPVVVPPTPRKPQPVDNCGQPSLCMRQFGTNRLRRFLDYVFAQKRQILGSCHPSRKRECGKSKGIIVRYQPLHCSHDHFGGGMFCQQPLMPFTVCTLCPQFNSSSAVSSCGSATEGSSCHHPIGYGVCLNNTCTFVNRIATPVDPSCWYVT